MQDSNQYTQAGNQLALAGLVVLVLSKLGVSADVSTVMTIFGGLLALVGIIKSFYTHKQLKNVAIATGAIKK